MLIHPQISVQAIMDQERQQTGKQVFPSLMRNGLCLFFVLMVGDGCIRLTNAIDYRSLLL